MVVVVAVLISALASLASTKSLPKDVVTCKRNQPNMDECMRGAIQDSIKALYKGVPELDLEVLDPMHVDKIVIDKKKKDGSPVDVDLEWNNSTITGIKSARIISAKANWDDGLISFEGEFTEPLDISGTYRIDGVILILPITGTGRFDIKLEGFKAHVKIHGHEEDRDGDKYMNVDKLAYTFDISHMTINYENLFNGDPILGITMNNFLNENWRDIIQEMTPSIEASFSSHFQEVARNFFNKVPMSEIAPL